MKRPDVKKIALCGVLVALATGIAAIEQWVPMYIIAPVPGIKLGLANIVTLFALLYVGPAYALGVVALRCFVSALLFSGLSAFPFSLGGALLALAAMLALRLFYRRWFSLAGLSMAGAAAHNTGQVVVASVVMRSGAVFVYLPPLLCLSVITGLLTGLLCELVFTRMERTGLVRPGRTVLVRAGVASPRASGFGAGGENEK